MAVHCIQLINHFFAFRKNFVFSVFTFVNIHSSRQTDKWLFKLYSINFLTTRTRAWNFVLSGSSFPCWHPID